MGTYQSTGRGRPGHVKVKRDGYAGKEWVVEYKAWHAMLQRCENPAYPNYTLYGGRGIKVCVEWKGPNGLSEFVKYVGRRPAPNMSIDRINNNGNYEPGNVRWADPITQNNNRSNNRHLTLKGRTQTVRRWSVEIGINEQTLHERLKRGWSVEKTLTTPLRAGYSRKRT